MATWRVNNSTLLGGEVCAPWQAGHAYSLGARVVCTIAYATTARRLYVYECTTAGNSHATTQPTWPTSGTIADGPDTLVWTTRRPDDGTWDNASCYLKYITNHAAAVTDTIYVHDAHSESPNFGSEYYYIIGGTTITDPMKIFCVDKDNSDALSSGAVVYNNSTNSLYFYNYVHTYGITFYSKTHVGVVNAAGAVSLGAAIIEGNGTDIGLKVDQANAMVMAGYTNQKCNSLIIKNTGVSLGLLTNSFRVFYQADIIWKGGTLTAPNGVTALITFTATTNTYGTANFIFEDVDLDAVGAGATATSLVSLTNSTYLNILFSRCKLPSDAGFTVTSGSWVTRNQGKVRLHHCSSGNRYYDFYEESCEGSSQDETTIVRTNGASDGTTSQSIKMISSVSTADKYNGLESPPITVWNSATTEKTFTVECIWDSATNIQDDEVWIELEYPANNTDGLGSVATDRCVILGTPADQAAGVGSGNWTTTGLTNPNSFKLSVTASPGKAGPVTARVYLAKASTTIYVDPLITIS